MEPKNWPQIYQTLNNRYHENTCAEQRSQLSGTKTIEHHLKEFLLLDDLIEKVINYLCSTHSRNHPNNWYEKRA